MHIIDKVTGSRRKVVVAVLSRFHNWCAVRIMLQYKVRENNTQQAVAAVRKTGTGGRFPTVPITRPSLQQVRELTRV